MINGPHCHQEKTQHSTASLVTELEIVAIANALQLEAARATPALPRFNCVQILYSVSSRHRRYTANVQGQRSRSQGRRSSSQR